LKGLTAADATGTPDATAGTLNAGPGVTATPRSAAAAQNVSARHGSGSSHQA
jgi:hypothetical protein